MSLLRLKSRIAKLESRISEDHKTLPPMLLLQALMVFDEGYHATQKEREAAARSLDAILGDLGD